MMKRIANTVPIKWVLITMLLIVICNTVSHASTQVNFRGNLIDNPPCDITGDNDPITIDFDEVGITKIDGINYMQDFTLKVICTNDLGDSVQLYMGYDGMNASFDNKAIQTNLRGLGIRLYHQGDVIAPNNEDIPVTMSGGSSISILLSAVPVREPSADLLEGTFNATGTVEIRYP